MLRQAGSGAKLCLESGVHVTVLTMRLEFMVHSEVGGHAGSTDQVVLPIVAPTCTYKL